MGQLILHHNGAYQLFTTIADGPCFVSALTIDQLTDYIREQYGASGIEALPERLARAHATGCSHSRGWTLRQCIATNRAGPNESKMSYDEFISKYLTLGSES